MFAVWMFLKDKQMSMWTSFFADCAVDFSPVIKVNGEDPKRFMKDIGVRVGKVKFVNVPEPDQIYQFPNPPPVRIFPPARIPKRLKGRCPYH